MAYAIFLVATQEPQALGSITAIYLNIPAFLIVTGGTLSATLIAHPLYQLVSGVFAFIKIFTRSAGGEFKAEIEEIAELSSAHMREGIPGLSKKLKEYPDNNELKDGLNLYINGYGKEDIEKYMETGIARKYDKDLIYYYVFETMATYSPSFGMIGTLVGLIFMLMVMGDDPSKIGPFLAVALITTFYGLILSKLLFGPMGNRFLHHAEVHHRLGKMRIEGVKHILNKQHPIFIRDCLASYLLPKYRKMYFEGEVAEN